MKHGELKSREYQYLESEDFYEMALQWIEQNNLEKAESCLKRTLELNENFIYAHITLAEVYGKLGTLHDAIRVLKKAFSIDSEFDRLPYLIALYANEAGDTIASLKYIARAIALNPDPLYLGFQEQVRGSMSGAE